MGSEGNNIASDSPSSVVASLTDHQQADGTASAESNEKRPTSDRPITPDPSPPISPAASQEESSISDSAAYYDDNNAPSIKFRPVVVLEKESQRSPIKTKPSNFIKHDDPLPDLLKGLPTIDERQDIFGASSPSRRRRGYHRGSSGGCTAAGSDVLSALLDTFATMCAPAGLDCAACGGEDGGNIDSNESTPCRPVGRARAQSLDNSVLVRADGGAGGASSPLSFKKTPKGGTTSEAAAASVSGNIPFAPFDLDVSAIQQASSPIRGDDAAGGSANNKNKDEQEEEDEDDEALLSPGHFFRPVSFDGSLASAIRPRQLFDD